jgi:hypothetical protein
MLINDSLRKESASAVEHNLLCQITEAIAEYYRAEIIIVK